MSVPEKIKQIFQGPVNRRIKPLIEEVGESIKTLPEGDPIVPPYVFEVMGIYEDTHPGDDFVGGKEYYYFENCFNAVESFKKGELNAARDHLMKAKWDFDAWALAHYLLGCVYLEERRFKDAFDQFEQGCDLEPFNHRPVAVMREITRYLLMNPID